MTQDKLYAVTIPMRLKRLIIGRAILTAFDPTLNDAAEVMQHAVEDEIVAADAVASGNLVNNIGVVRALTFTGLLKSLDITTRKPELQVVLNVLERGREPGHYTPIRPLVQWLKVRGIVPNEGTSEQDYISLAFAISKTHFEEGLEGRHPVQIARQKTKFRIVRMFQLRAERLAQGLE